MESPQPHKYKQLAFPGVRLGARAGARKSNVLGGDGRRSSLSSVCRAGL